MHLKSLYDFAFNNFWSRSAPIPGNKKNNPFEIQQNIGFSTKYELNNTQGFLLFRKSE